MRPSATILAIALVLSGPRAAGAADESPVLSRLTPVGVTADVEAPPWNIELSELVRRSPGPNLQRLRERLSVAQTNAASDHPARRTSGARRIAELEREIRLDCLRALVASGLSVSSKNGVTPERTQALALIASLVQPHELVDAVRVLEGESVRANLVNSEADVARALFAALASEPIFGQPRLVTYGVRGGDDVASLARECLPRQLSQNALNAVRAALAGTSEREINRAAMIAGAHPAASLIPSLIAAQFEQTTPPPQGDEAWIAIGKTTSYVAGLIPVVGNGSAAFQPVPGVVFEGSILRIMESAVTIYRTEVHNALVATVQGTTGQPAPPFGLDRDRWMAWYRNDYPQLAQAYAREVVEQAIVERVKTTAPRDDG